MIGAIAGDIIGSAYEFGRTKSKEFPLFGAGSGFTDDTVMTVAIAQAILTDGDYRRAALDFGRRYPYAGYGGSFAHWLIAKDPKPYGSYGNGSAMRASPVGFAFDTVDGIRPAYGHDESCQKTVPEAIICFLESGSYEDCVRNAVSLGGDADTLACIAGGIAEAYYGPVPPEIRHKAREILAPELWEITEDFCGRFRLTA